jgi:hypothetical protein
MLAVVHPGGRQKMNAVGLEIVMVGMVARKKGDPGSLILDLHPD